METALQQIRDMISSAGLSPEVRRQMLWALAQLPPMYQSLARTYESRYRDSILGQVQGMMNTLAAAKNADCPDAPQVLEALVAQLRAMHDQLGIPSLGLKVPVAKAPRKRKAG